MSVFPANITKRFKKSSRPLTTGEKAMAYSVFADNLAVDDIQITTAFWVFKNYAVSPNGNIYFHPEDWIEDFSKQPLHKQAWLIHELTHIWQIQQGIKVVRNAIIDRRYRYILEAGKPFLKYGIEQQAKIVEDYFIKRTQGKDCSALQTCIPFLSDN